MLVAVVDAVIGAVASGPLRNTAVVCLAGELGFCVAFVFWTHWMKKEKETERREERGLNGEPDTEDDQ